MTQSEADAQLNDYQKREINGITMSQIDVTNFEDNATVTLYGCYLGGSQKWTDKQIEDYSFGQRFANYLGGNRTVRAFTGSGLHKTNSSGKIIYDGTMIRAEDANTQKTNLSIFKSGTTPTIKK